METSFSGRLDQPYCHYNDRWVYRGLYNNLGFSRMVMSVRGKKAGRSKLFPIPHEHGSLNELAARRIRQAQIQQRNARRRVRASMEPNAFVRVVRAGYGTKYGEYMSPWGKYSGSGLALAAVPFPELTLSTEKHAVAATQKLFRKASQPVFEGHLQIGEMLETVAMLRNPLASFREAMDVLWHTIRKKTSGKHKGGALREAIASSYQEQQYGIQPLLFGLGAVVGDMVGAVVERPCSVEYIKARSAEERKQTTMLHGVQGLVNYLYEVTDTEYAVVRSGMLLGEKPYPTGFHLRAARLGLGSNLTGYASQAWALMPLSFAVDWVVNIGALLQECRPLQGVPIWSWQSQNRYVVRDVRLISMGNLTTNSIAEAVLWVGSLQRTTNLKPTGTLQWGPGLFSVSQGISAAIIASGIGKSLWKKLPWH